jgi:hypothetical protein
LAIGDEVVKPETITELELMTRTQRLAQLEADLSSGNRVVRMGEIWSRRDGGEPNLARFVDVETEDLLWLLRERREMQNERDKWRAMYLAKLLVDSPVTERWLTWSRSRGYERFEPVDMRIIRMLRCWAKVGRNS